MIIHCIKATIDPVCDQIAAARGHYTQDYTHSGAIGPRRMVERQRDQKTNKLYSVKDNKKGGGLRPPPVNDDQTDCDV